MVVAALLLAFGMANCPDQGNLLVNPADPGSFGPYAVTSRTIRGVPPRNLTLEIWFPADRRSRRVEGKKNEPCSWDIRQFVPPDQARKIPDTGCEGLPEGSCCNPTVDQVYPECEVGLEMAAEGVFPLIVFIHGTGGWRTNSATLVHRWVSRGFVVVSADYPGICLNDLVSQFTNPFLPVPNTDQEGDTRGIMRELDRLSFPGLQFLRDRGETNRVRRVVAGHSAGGFVAGRLPDLFGVIVPMAAAGTYAWDPNHPITSTLVLGAEEDGIVNPRGQRSGYETTDPLKRLVIAADVGHQFCSDLCWLGAAQGGIAKIAFECGIAIGVILGPLATDGCQYVDPSFASVQQGWSVISSYSAAVMEELTRCDLRMTARVPFLQDQLGGEKIVSEFLQEIIAAKTAEDSVVAHTDV